MTPLIVNEAKEQLDEWWDHPYGITKPDGSFTDRCLNGGARDRSSVLGKVRTYEEACVPAHDARAKMGQYPSETYLHVL
uniref:LexA regulated function n=1 Tax=Klebsiella pneumoniae TaxID=573 RepID=A0A8B0SSB0_KLEPN|nr:LexA regulated function [Klebsiella pneumoniae]